MRRLDQILLKSPLLTLLAGFAPRLRTDQL